MSLPLPNPMHHASQNLLLTRRLSLRPLTIDDLDALHALLAQPGVRRHLCDGRTLRRSDVAAMLATSQRLRAASGEGLWAILENARGWTLAGVAGLWPYRHVDLAPPAAELVFALDEGCWGRGLANESCGALLGYARDMLGWQTAQASTNFGNNASVRTLTRLDFVECGAVPAQGGPLRVFRRTL